MAERKKAPSSAINKDQDRAIAALILALEKCGWYFRSVDPQVKAVIDELIAEARKAVDFYSPELPED